MRHSSRYTIFAGFSVMLLLLLLIISIALRNMRLINESMDQIVSVWNVKSTLVSNLRSIARERSLLIYHMIITRDPFLIDEDIQKASILAGEFIRSRDRLRELSLLKDEQDRLDEMMKIVTLSSSLHQIIMEMLQHGKYDEANRLLQEKSLAVQGQLLTFYDKLQEEQRLLMEKAVNDARNQYQESFIFMLILGGLVVITGSVVMIYTLFKNAQIEKFQADMSRQLELNVEERTRNLKEANHNLEESLHSLKEAQQQLVQAEKMAALGGLVAGIAHEINTPVGIGVTAATSLQEELNTLNGKYQAGSMMRSSLEQFIAHGLSASEILISNLNRAANLIRSFKQVAVDQSNDNWRVISIKEYVDEVVLSLKPKLKGTKITIANLCDPEIRIFTNPGSISQIITNLVINSLIHGYEKDDSGHIRILCSKSGDKTLLDYQDDGKGVPVEIQDRIFDPFFTTKRGEGGTGLGLHIVYNLVVSTLKGEILLMHNKEKGASFRLLLPILEGRQNGKR